MKNLLVSNFLDFFNEEKNSQSILDPRSYILDGKESVELYEIFGSRGNGGNINFFPSTIKGGCYEMAIFVSFSKSPKGIKLKKNNCISLDVVLKKMVQQVLGGCDGINQEIVLITDEINTNVSREWEGNLKAIKKRCKSLDIYYIFPDGDSKKVNDMFGV